MNKIEQLILGRANKVNLVMVMMVLTVATMGCLGPGASEYACEGTVKSSGKTYVGKAKDENQAGLNACNKYCLEEDGEAREMIRMWLDSDEAVEFERKYKRKPRREDATIESKAILNYVTQTCAVRCMAQANKGKHTLETGCK